VTLELYLARVLAAMPLQHLSLHFDCCPKRHFSDPQRPPRHAGRRFPYLSPARVPRVSSEGAAEVDVAGGPGKNRNVGTAE
jgi:hypothetical protein